MTAASTISGTAYEGGSVVVMARCVDSTDANITQAAINSITYTVTNIATGQATPGHSGQPLTVSAVVFDSLQSGSGWSADKNGYNFRHVIGATALPDGDATYQYEAKLSFTTGDVGFVLAKITTMRTYS